MVQNSLRLRGTVCHRRDCWVLFSYVRAMIFYFFSPSSAANTGGRQQNNKPGLRSIAEAARGEAKRTDAM